MWGSACLGMGKLHAWAWENFMKAMGNFMEEFLVVLGKIVKACFRWFFKLLQNSLLLFVRW